MNEQWQELKETIIELRDNDGTGTQQEVCKFLANLMDVLERDASYNSDAQTKKGYWISAAMQGELFSQIVKAFHCSECGAISVFRMMDGKIINGNFCPACKAKMEVQDDK